MTPHSLWLRTRRAIGFLVALVIGHSLVSAWRGELSFADPSTFLPQGDWWVIVALSALLFVAPLTKREAAE